MKGKSRPPEAADPPLQQAILSVRRLSRALAGSADRAHADLGITASMRAVMEILHGRGPRTVPQIAREQGVSRQHIQMVVNALAAAGFVDCVGNPDHLRSPLVRLGEAGLKAYETGRRREARLLADLAKRIPAGDLKVTLKTLNAMELGLNRQEAKQGRAGSRV